MGSLSSIASSVRQSLSDAVFEGRVLHKAGILEPMRPDKAARIASTFIRWGASPATGIATAAIHHGDATAIIDEKGSLSFEQVHRRSNALAHAFERSSPRRPRAEPRGEGHRKKGSREGTAAREGASAEKEGWIRSRARARAGDD